MLNLVLLIHFLSSSYLLSILLPLFLPLGLDGPNFGAHADGGDHADARTVGDRRRGKQHIHLQNSRISNESSVSSHY